MWKAKDDEAKKAQAERAKSVGTKKAGPANDKYQAEFYHTKGKTVVKNLTGADVKQGTATTKGGAFGHGNEIRKMGEKKR